jgi:hypothetical protein
MSMAPARDIRRMPRARPLPVRRARDATRPQKQLPLSDIPFQTILDRVAAGIYKAKPVRLFGFEEIQEAHRLMDAYGADGKLIVTLEKTVSRKVA